MQICVSRQNKLSYVNTISGTFKYNDSMVADTRTYTKFVGFGDSGSTRWGMMPFPVYFPTGTGKKSSDDYVNVIIDDWNQTNIFRSWGFNNKTFLLFQNIYVAIRQY